MLKRGLNTYSDREIKEAYYKRRYEHRRKRMARLERQGRLFRRPNLATPPSPEPFDPQPIFTGLSELEANEKSQGAAKPPTVWKRISNGLLLLVEVGAVVGFIFILWSLRGSVLELNQEIAVAQQRAINIEPLPTATIPPVISMVVLPSGHQPPVEGRPIVFEEAGEIPDHLLPLVDAYVPPPIPTPSAEQPRQIKIENIEVNAPIFQGHEDEQLKKGVGHSIGTANPGEAGNMVLSAHNDIYGEIFRHLDQLGSGDEIVVSTGRQSYTYLVNEIKVVEPTAVEVMAPTEHSSLTLISCYPYLVDNKRIVVSADLIEEGS